MVCHKIYQLTEEGEIARKIVDRSSKSTTSKGRLLNVNHVEKHVKNGRKIIIKWYVLGCSCMTYARVSVSLFSNPSLYYCESPMPVQAWKSHVAPTMFATMKCRLGLSASSPKLRYCWIKFQNSLLSSSLDLPSLFKRKWRHDAPIFVFSFRANCCWSKIN